MAVVVWLIGGRKTGSDTFIQSIMRSEQAAGVFRLVPGGSKHRATQKNVRQSCLVI